MRTGKLKVSGKVSLPSCVTPCRKRAYPHSGAEHLSLGVPFWRPNAADSGLNLRQLATPPRCPCFGKSADEFLFFIPEGWSADYADFRRFGGSNPRLKSGNLTQSHGATTVGIRALLRVFVPSCEPHRRFRSRGPWFVSCDPKRCPYGHTTNNFLRDLCASVVKNVGIMFGDCATYTRPEASSIRQGTAMTVPGLSLIWFSVVRSSWGSAPNPGIFRFSPRA